ncbi:MAG: hypothetical protein ACOCUV_00610 [bacterium]
MAKATKGITNLYLFNKFVNNVEDAVYTDINDTEKIRYIIDQTCNLIEKKCDRSFESTEYKEWVEAYATPYIVLNNYPITRIKHVAGSTIPYIKVKADKDTYEVATISSNNNSVILTSITTEGTDSEDIFNYSDYANCSSLSAVINDLSGWESEVYGNNDDKLTQKIRPTDSIWAVNQTVNLMGTYDGISVRLDTDSDSIITPINGGCFAGTVYVNYIAGYTLPECDDVGGDSEVEGNVPEALTKIANEIILDTIRYQDEDGNMKSEKTGDYSYTRSFITSCVDRHWADLSAFANKNH